MARSRNALHINKLEDFARFCEDDQWLRESPKGEYEVLRMIKEGKAGPLLVYKSASNPEHYTIEGHSFMMFMEWRKFLRASE